jgi:hypothetical protein
VRAACRASQRKLEKTISKARGAHQVLINERPMILTLVKFPTPAKSRNMLGTAAVPISRARPALETRSEENLQNRGSSSKKRASEPPTTKRPRAPNPSLVIHFIAAPVATAVAAPVPSPAALSKDDVTIEFDIQPVMWTGRAQS